MTVVMNSKCVIAAGTEQQKLRLMYESLVGMLLHICAPRY